jgi:hypothetical protein
VRDPISDPTRRHEFPVSAPVRVIFDRALTEPAADFQSHLFGPTADGVIEVDDFSPYEYRGYRLVRRRG